MTWPRVGTAASTVPAGTSRVSGPGQRRINSHPLSHRQQRRQVRHRVRRRTQTHSPLRSRAGRTTRHRARIPPIRSSLQPPQRSPYPRPHQKSRYQQRAPHPPHTGPQQTRHAVSFTNNVARHSFNCPDSKSSQRPRHLHRQGLSPSPATVDPLVRGLPSRQRHLSAHPLATLGHRNTGLSLLGALGKIKSHSNPRLQSGDGRFQVSSRPADLIDQTRRFRYPGGQRPRVRSALKPGAWTVERHFRSGRNRARISRLHLPSFAP